MSVARTGAPGQARLAAHDGVVAVGSHVGAHAGDLVAEHEARLEQVLGDHRGAVGDRQQRDRLRLQVGGQARIRQRHDVEALRTLVRSRTRNPSAQHLNVGAGAHQLVQRDLQVLGMPAAYRDVPARGHRGHRPRAGDDPVSHGRVGRRVAAPSTPSISSVDEPTPSICAPIATSIWHRSTISGSRAALSMTVRALGEHRGRQDVLRRADAREVEPDLSPRAARPPRPPCSRARRESRRPSAPGRRSACPADANRSRRHLAAPPSRVRCGRAAGPSTQIEPRILRTSSYGACDSSRDGSSGTVMLDARRRFGWILGVLLHVAAQAAEQLVHDRHIRDRGQVAQRGLPRRQQRRRHQLEHAVLGAYDVDLAPATGHRRSLAEPAPGPR